MRPLAIQIMKAAYDADETEGRALYRARANALAKVQLSYGRKRIRIRSALHKGEA